MMKTSTLYSFPIAVGSREDLLAAARRAASSGGTLITPNPSILARALRDRALAAAWRSAALAVPDGYGVARLLARRGIETAVLPGVELGELLLDDPHTLALVGGAPGVADAALRALTARHPACRPAFALSGYALDAKALRALIRATAPDLVYIGIGSPRQELLAARLSRDFPRVAFLSLGGSLDVYAGKVRRAPALFRRARLEWLWRVLRSPRRLPKLLFAAFTLARAEKSAKI